MKPRLLVVTSTFPRWKDDTDPPFVYELSRRFTSDFDVVVHTPHYHGSLIRETMDGMQIHRFRYFLVRFEKLAGGQGIVPKLRRNKLYYLLLPFFLTAQFFSLLLLVSKKKPNIIHAHWLIPQGFLAVLVKRIFGIPIVVTAHGADVFSFREGVYVRLKKLIVNNTDRIVTVSNLLAKTLIEDTRSFVQPEVIPMGVDASLFSPNRRSNSIRHKHGISGPFLLYVGRLTEKKGVQYLIDAMVLVKADCPGSRLLIVGHGELEEKLRKQVECLGLQNVVFFTGGLVNKELAAYYASADIFIGPSVQVKSGDTEGFGLTFVEAAMCGCLVIGTRVGGIEDIIQDGETGYLVPPADKNALAAKIIEVIATLNQHENMRKQARNAAVSKFDWNLIAAGYKDLYLSVM